MANRRFTFTVGQEFDKDGHTVLAVIPKREEVLKTIAKSFGGFTMCMVRGGWENPKGELVLEVSMVITVVSSLAAGYEIAQGLAQWIGTVFNQDSILLTVETLDSVDYVTQDSKVPAVAWFG